MAKLDELPKLPKCLRGLGRLIGSDGGKLQNSENLSKLKASMIGCGEAYSPLFPPLALTSRGDNGQSETSHYQNSAGSGGRCPPRISNDNTIAFLRRELIFLRQMDVSLLCQLWRLNDQLIEYKRAIHERSADSISIGSSRDLMETSNDYENISYNTPIYENTFELGNIYENTSSASLGLVNADDTTESIYLEPISYDTDDDDSWSSGRSKRESSSRKPRMLEPMSSTSTVWTRSFLARKQSDGHGE